MIEEIFSFIFFSAGIVSLSCVFIFISLILWSALDF